MVNERILTLIKQPLTITADDLPSVEKELARFPYAQGFRALALLGTHRFRNENYQNYLSETAAYTTDKKILFQLVNGKMVREEELILNVDNQKNKEAGLMQENLIPEIISPPNPVDVNGKPNRILFEGEEDFPDKPAGINETIEQVVKEEEIIEDVPVEMEAEEAGTPEKIVMQTENEVLGEVGSAELSFHGLDDFMPQVKVTPPSKPMIETVTLKQNNRHEEEMKRLIAEVEAKMKASKKPKEAVLEEEPQNADINFAEHIPFEPKTIVDSDNNQESKMVEEVSPANSGWKPMAFSSEKPDALIDKSKIENQKEEHEAERPVMNVSFFADQVENINREKDAETDDTETESNVPQFINTWQNWLKLDKSAIETDEPAGKPAEEIENEVNDEPSAEPENSKEAAIEKFIETEPKISRLKEDTNYTVKEKADDISHLMTETLANLYVEQRLYAKAIKAFEVLKTKHPDRKAHFEERILQIKDIRQNK